MVGAWLQVQLCRLPICNALQRNNRSKCQTPAPAILPPSTIDAAAQQIASIIVGNTIGLGLQLQTLNDGSIPDFTNSQLAVRAELHCMPGAQLQA